MIAGKPAKKARGMVVELLQERGFIVKTDDHAHSIGKCYRCKSVVEPYLSPQWFVKTGPLAEPAIKAVEDGRVQFRAQGMGEHLLRVDAEHQGLVHLAPDLVGHTAYPAWLLRRCCGERSPCSRTDATGVVPQPLQRRHEACPRRRTDVSRHLVLVGALALLHARLAGQDQGACRSTIPRRCLSRALTSSSSGWRA